MRVRNNVSILFIYLVIRLRCDACFSRGLESQVDLSYILSHLKEVTSSARQRHRHLKFAKEVYPKVVEKSYLKHNTRS